MQPNPPSRENIVWLTSVNNVGFTQLGLIINYCRKHEVSLGQVCDNPRQLRYENISEKVVKSIQSFKKEYTVSNWIEHLNESGIKYLLMTDNYYPTLLKTIHQPPPVLFYKGEFRSRWWRLPVSMVGSRNMTAYGKMATQSLVSELVDLGASTVSGGMYGVDLVVHQETIVAGGQTTVVLGHGHFHSYPSWISRDHQQLLEEEAVILSQFAPYVHPSRGSFVARNRVVAGISPTLVVVEAAEKSGTHVTAQFALDENRDVCAVPGPINNPYSQGTKWLINQGARMVSSGAEILFSDGHEKEHKNLRNSAEKTSSSTGKKQLNSEVLQLIESEPLCFDQLLEQLKMDSSSLMIELTQLEIMGKIVKFGQYYRAVL